MSVDAASTVAARARFAAAAASGADWQAVAQACIDRLGPTDGCTLGFIYVADTLAAHLDDMVAVLREATGVRDWTGSVGVGVLGGAGGKSDGEFFDRPAAAVLATRLSPDDYRLFAPLTGDIAPLKQAAGGWLDRNGAPAAYVHADPRGAELLSVINALNNDLGAFLVGGMPSSRSAFPQVGAAGDVVGVGGALLGRGAGIQVGVSQGCAPVGPRRTITACHENVMIEIDGRPALEALKADIGPELADDLSQLGELIHVARPVAGADTADMQVRNLTGVDPKRGLVGVADLVEKGQTILFVRRDQASAEADLRRMLRQLKKRAGGAIKGGLYVTCLARGRNIFGADGDELAILREELGDVPLAGYFAAGEISAGRLYGYTGVLTLFT